MTSADLILSGIRSRKAEISVPELWPRMSLTPRTQRAQRKALGPKVLGDLCVLGVRRRHQFPALRSSAVARCVSGGTGRLLKKFPVSLREPNQHRFVGWFFSMNSPFSCHSERSEESSADYLDSSLALRMTGPALTGRATMCLQRRNAGIRRQRLRGLARPFPV
jgi:hypothetical protein